MVDEDYGWLARYARLWAYLDFRPWPGFRRGQLSSHVQQILHYTYPRQS